jgi:hypothetical protein
LFLAFLFVFVLLGIFLLVFYSEVVVKCQRIREREAEKHWRRERERKWEEKKNVGPVTVIKLRLT